MWARSCGLGAVGTELWVRSCGHGAVGTELWARQIKAYLPVEEGLRAMPACNILWLVSTVKA